MNAAIRELREAESTLAKTWEGNLSQQGGDCPVSFLVVPVFVGLNTDRPIVLATKILQVGGAKVDCIPRGDSPATSNHQS